MVNIPPRRVYYGYMETTQGIETLFRRYYPAMRRLATMLLHDEEAARDTVQDVFEKLLSRGVRPDRPEAGVYLLKAVRNACLNRICDFDTETRLRNLYLLDSEAADADDWPDEALLASLDRAMASLGQDSRRIVELRFRRHATFREMGEALGISDAAAFKALARALTRR